MGDRRDRDRDRKRDRDDCDRLRHRHRHGDTDRERDCDRDRKDRTKRSHTPDRPRSRHTRSRTRSPDHRRSRYRSTDRHRSRRSHHCKPSPDQSWKRRKHYDEGAASVVSEFVDRIVKEKKQQQKSSKDVEMVGDDDVGGDVDANEIEMMRMMGIPVGFDSTKGKPVEGNDVREVKTTPKLELSREQKERIRFRIVKRKKDFIYMERNVGGLRPTQRMSVEEQVARFLHIVGKYLRNHFVSWFYRRSGSTTSRHFHRVLSAIISLEDQYLRQPTGDIVPKEIQEQRRFYPFFKDCIGAIDGTHVHVRVPSKDAPRYRGRKGYPMINVLAACTFDLKFTYILSGWEGTASDSRIIKDTFTRNDKLLIPEGKYYLVDVGLPFRGSLIAPYRGVRYHLKEYSSRAPQNSRELFNLRHSSLLNAIEIAFGVLKKRFPIIRSTTEPFYLCETQSDIFLACCILHNFLLDEDRDKELEEEVLHEILNVTREEETLASRDMDDRGEQIRNSIANEMWSDYLLHQNI
ncbi:hypothetical protein OSB04_016262 [Centaurea solstitialis]|uniref:Nuclease HARBI1 n=1 Tax=Centaurea solstitialis TaxID=347529 RepID=A0AA38W8A8_9ASTR|nr:hypothetical protein OSB04_016262 [Centaurea solstitialis]